MSLPLIREHYGIAAWRGRRVTVDGKPGIIIGSQPGTMRLRVRFDDGTVLPAHPTWLVDYEPEVSS